MCLDGIFYVQMLIEQNVRRIRVILIGKEKNEENFKIKMDRR
jgi:hypothetical protein